MRFNRLVGLMLAVGLMTGCGVSPAGRFLGSADRFTAASTLVDNEENVFGVQSMMDDLESSFEEEDPTGGDQPAPAPAGPSVKKTLSHANKDGSTTARTYYSDGSLEVTRTSKDGKPLLDETFSAPMTATPSIVASGSPEIPADAKTLAVQVTYKVTPNGATGTGSMVRTYVARKLFRTEATTNLTTATGETATRSRIAEGYTKGKAAHVLTTANTKRGAYKLEITLDPATGAKVGNGELTRPDGTVTTTTTTENPDKTKVRVTENTKTKQRITLNYAADKTGTGTIEDMSTDPATPIAKMEWDSSGKGTVTYTNGKVRKFHV